MRELVNLPSVAFTPIDASLLPSDPSKLPRPQKRIAQLLAKGSATPSPSASKSWSLRFLLSPTSLNPSASDPTHVSSVSFCKNAFAPDSSPFDRSARVTTAGPADDLPASLAFRSVGYKSSPIPGLSELRVPFDERLGIIPNDVYGRVLNPAMGPGNLTAAHVPGMYCAGWVKRGPTGVIASTMDDAFVSADVIARDWEQGAQFLNGSEGGSTGLGWEGLREEAQKRGLRRVSWSDWKRIDEVEKDRGRARGKEREKIASVQEMLRVLDG